jgi:CDP-diacylglycerol---serine O-phosphatidyltransferase
MRNYLLVNTVTAASFILGSIAIASAIHGFLYPSFALALLAFACDAADGYLARKLKAESRLGAIFDTVADVVVYLLYPAILLYYVFRMNSPVGIFSIILFLVTGIYRLFKFTAAGFLKIGEKIYYLGMPVFFSHFMILIIIITNILDKKLLLFACPLLLSTMSIMMVTKLKFRKPTSLYLGIAMIIILIFSLSLFFIKA